MKKNIKILVVTILVLFIWLLCSCGSVKKNSSKSKEETKVEETTKSDTSTKTETEKVEETNVKKKVDITVDNKNETVIRETTYKPIDNTKPASVTTPEGKKIDLNNSEYHEKETIHKNNTKTNTSKSEEEIKKLQEKEKSEKLAKLEAQKAETLKKLEELEQLDREEYTWWSWWFLLIPAAVYFVWEKYR